MMSHRAEPVVFVKMSYCAGIQQVLDFIISLD